MTLQVPASPPFVAASLHLQSAWFDSLGGFAVSRVTEVPIFWARLSGRTA